MDPYDARELLAAGGHAVLEVMLHMGAHAPAVVRGVWDTSAEGSRYRNKRFAAMATEMGLAGPERPERRLAGQAAGSPTRRRPPVRTSSARSAARGFPFLPAGHGAPQLDMTA